MDQFTEEYSVMNNDLSHLYALPAPAQEFGRIDFPVDSKRSGILGQAAFLALTSKPSDTSPTERGKFDREHFLCQVDRKSTRLNSSHLVISYAVFCLKKKK